MSQFHLYRKKLSTAFLSGVVLTASLGVFVACTESAKARINFIHKDAPRAGVVAKIGNEEITEDALIANDKIELFNLKKQEYELRMKLLEKLLVDKLVGAEAKKEKMSVDEFINKKIVGGDIKISDDKVKKFIAQRGIPENNVNPQIRERIVAYLQSNERQDRITAYLGKVTKSSPVEVYFNKPRMTASVETGDAPTFGKKDATVTVVEFSDFQCPFCSKAADTVNQLKKKYGSKIKLAFRHFPLPMHPNAKGAAEAAMCVHDQNADKFWTFHDLMFKNQNALDDTNLQKLAKDAGVDSKKFEECVKSKKFASYVQKDVEYGEKLGVRSTPTFFINGQLLQGAVPFESFVEAIEEELAERS